ncbi:MAG: glycosyltransferase family 4 protein [Ruminococcaceae bacterium]|nr:glycosyltransferase family 4 protein [Oscillospiraceae bacterium]
MKKVLFVASIAVHIKSFHIPYLNYFKDNGYETYVATRDENGVTECDKNIKIPFERSPFKKNNFIAYRKLKKLIKSESFDIIHCHTPVAAFLTRLAARKARKKGTKVIYTAHGFHFFKGAPFLNWLIYFPVEWISSFFTDVLITMNEEDFAFAKKHLHAKRTEYVHGVGINKEKFSNSFNEKLNKRSDIAVPDDAVMLFSVGELNKNKNHEKIVRALSGINDKNIHYCIAGSGNNESYLKKIADELGVEDQLHLLGYRDDIDELLGCADIFCFPSYREGLPVSVMEAMAMGLPCVVSEIRGNKDLIENEKGGFLCNPSDVNSFKEKIKILLNDKELCKKFGEFNKEKVKIYTLDYVEKEMIKIYEECI